MVPANSFLSASLWPIYSGLLYIFTYVTVLDDSRGEDWLFLNIYKESDEATTEVT